MDRPGVRQVLEGSGEQGKMEKTGCKIICAASTTLAVKGLMMMMMMSSVERVSASLFTAMLKETHSLSLIPLLVPLPPPPPRPAPLPHLLVLSILVLDCSTFKP